MKRRYLKRLGRFLSLFLSLTLLVPGTVVPGTVPSALALRPRNGGLEEPTAVTKEIASGLGHSPESPGASRPATGLEENREIMEFVRELKASTPSFQTQVITFEVDRALNRLERHKVLAHGFGAEGARKIISSMLMGAIRPMEESEMRAMEFDEASLAKLAESAGLA